MGQAFVHTRCAVCTDVSMCAICALSLDGCSRQVGRCVRACDLCDIA